MNEILLGVAIACVGLAAVERAVRRAGGRRWPRPRQRAVLGALGAALAGLAAAPWLGLRYGPVLVPRALAGSLFALLAVYLWQLLPRLRPLLGREIPRRPHAVFFWLPSVVYLTLMPWATAERPPDGDEPYYLLVAHSLAYDLDAELTNNYLSEDSRHFVGRALEPQPQDPRGPGGEMYSRHSAVLPVVLAPAYRLAGLHGALAVMCIFAAGLCWTTLRLARHFFADRPGPALIAYFILAFTSPLLLYSYQVWVEIPAAWLLAVGLDTVLDLNEERLRRVRPCLPLAAVLLVLPLLKIRFLLVALPLLPLLAWRLGPRSRRIVILLLGACALLMAGILGFNQMRYGNALKYHHFSHWSFYWNDLGRYPRGLAGLFFDCAFGLFATAPIWILLFAPGRGKARPLALLTWIMGPYVVLLIPRAGWYGGWSPPFRYGCVALSLLACLLIPPLTARRGVGARLSLGALGTATLALSALWVARPGWTYNIANGRSHLVDFLTIGQGVDVSRFLPSAVRANHALWLWPPAAVLAMVLLWRWRRRAGRGPLWLGASVPVVVVAALVIAAHTVPSRVAEAEDPHIAHSGGAMWPDDWVERRLRYRGSWRLQPTDLISIPVVPGGRYCRLELQLKSIGKTRPFVRVGAAGSTPTVRRLAKTAGWTSLQIRDLDWPEGVRELEISLLMPPDGDPKSSLLLDRVTLAWSDVPRAAPAR
jgi:hypothetical protein